MGETAGTVLVVAVVVIAVAQICISVLAFVAGRRLLAELVPLLTALTEATAHLQEAADHIGALAEHTGATVVQARRAAAQVGAIAGAGRSLVEGALGAAILRRLAPGALGGTAAGGASAAAVKTAIELVMGLYQTLAARRRQRREEDDPPDGVLEGAEALAQASAAGEPDGRHRRGGRPRMGIGTVRRVDGPAPPPGRRSAGT